MDDLNRLPGYIVVTDYIPADGSRDVADELQRLIETNPNRTIYFPDGLYRIGVENGIGTHPVGQFCHLVNGHDRAGLVVDHHNGNQNGVLSEGIPQVRKGNIAQMIRVEVGDFKSLRFQIFHAV